MKLPSLFISHGSPMMAVEPGTLGPMLQALGTSLPTPRAILVLSPHWMSPRLEVQATPQPATVHDFGGFPRRLYDLQYPAPGAPGVAAEVITLLRAQGFDAVANDSVGFDHGAWVPLLYLAPDAKIPVLQIAQPATRDPRVLYSLGAALASLREQGILIVASGSLTHNLYEFRMGSTGNGYAQKFADWVADTLTAGDLETFFNYRSLAPGAERAHPTDEHFLPLYFALGAAGAEGRQVRRLAAGVSDDVLSMDSFVFGEVDS